MKEYLNIYATAENREATATIKGYQYQFNKTIIEILESNDEDICFVEGIEDIDKVLSSGNIELIQCKHYEKSKYSDSVIKKPILHMFNHFASNKSKNIKYSIYGIYSESVPSGKPIYINREDFKQKFLTYKSEKIQIKEYEKLNLSNSDIDLFISKLEININAVTFEQQENMIIKKMKYIFSCNDDEATDYFEKAKAIIGDISILDDHDKRKLKKVDLIQLLKLKNQKLYNIWQMDYFDRKKYISNVKKELGFSKQHLSAYERFILIEIDNHSTIVDIAMIIKLIAKKLSELPNENSKKKRQTFCPYFYLYNCEGMNEKFLPEVKRKLDSDGEKLIDGYKFLDAEFDINFIKKKPTKEFPITIKFVNSEKELNKILEVGGSTREIYNFYINDVFYRNNNYHNQMIRIHSTNNLLEIFK